MKRIIIGKEGSQPFAIPDPNVSRRHATLDVYDDGRMMLTDTKSTNGTYIYMGQSFVRLSANSPYPVTPDTMIQLGPNTRFHVSKLLKPAGPPKPIGQQGFGQQGQQGLGQQGQKPQPPKPKPKPEPVRVDVYPLKRVADVYHQNKLEIEAKRGTVNTLRSMSILASLIATGAGKFLMPDLFKGYANAEALSWIAGIGLGALILAVLFAYINTANKKLIHRQKQNEDYYAYHYVCPKCKKDFRGKLYDHIIGAGKCPQCKAEYYEAR